MSVCVNLSIFLAFLLSSCQFKLIASADASQRATYKKIYTDITHFTSCFRRFNGTHQIGCASDSVGNTGVLHYVNDSASLQWLLEKGNQAPYIPLITSSMFTNATIRTLQRSGKINGILVIFMNASNPAEYPESFSPDSNCPGLDFGLYANKSDYSCDKMNWNPDGNSLMFEDFPFPISIILDQAEANKVVECYMQHNKPDSNGNPPSYPLCASEVKAFMHGAKDSATCWRRTNMAINLSPEQYCQVMGSLNIHASLGSMARPRANSSVIVLGARIDAFSMFENLVPGANNHISGVVTMLAVAEALSKVKQEVLNKAKDVWFMLFEGEAFDYIGSTRVVYDILKKQFPVPMQLEDIDFFLELFQLANGVNSNTLYLHSDPLSAPNYSSQIQHMMQSLSAGASAANLSFANATHGRSLPPSSVQQFLKHRKMPALVLTDHADVYTNRFFNSRLDTAYTINATYPPGLNETQKYNHVTPQARLLASAATAIANGVYSYAMDGAGNNSSHSVVVNEASVANMLYCFLVNPKCDLFYKVVEPGSNTAVLDQAVMPYPFYVSVSSKSNIDPIVYIIHQLLLYYTGDVVPGATAQSCNGTFANDTTTQYFWINGALNTSSGSRTNMCIASSILYSNATSPAFEIDGYDFTSKEYPTWTESVWPSSDAFHVRLFLLPSAELQGVTLGSGITILVLSLLLSYCIRKRSAILFAKEGIL